MLLSHTTTEAPIDRRGRQSMESGDVSPSRRHIRSRLTYRRVRFARLSETEFEEHFAKMSLVMTEATRIDSTIAPWASPDWYSRKDDVRRNADAIMAFDGELLVGFVAYRVRVLCGRSCVHLMSGYVRPNYQGRGIGYASNARIGIPVLLRHSFRGIYMAADLLNPIVMRAWKDRAPTARHIYPAIGPASENPRLVGAATELAKAGFPALEFDSKTGVLAGKTLPRQNDAPLSGDALIDQHFRSHVRPSDGDTVLMLLDGTRGAVFSYGREILRAVPRILRRTASRRYRDEAPDVGDGR